MAVNHEEEHEIEPVWSICSSTPLRWCPNGSLRNKQQNKTNIDYLVQFLFAGDDGQVPSQKAERLKVHLGKLVQQLLQLEHSAFRVLRLIRFDH